MDDYPYNADAIDDSMLENVKTNKVQIDALVLLKLMKHGRDAHPTPGTGLLLGVDVKGTLSVSNCFPFATTKDPEMDAQSYQLTMLRNLRALNYDASTAGWYQSTYMGTFWSQGMVETQYSYQTAFSNSVVLVYDPAKTGKSLSLCAMRLTDKFMEFYAVGKFTSEQIMAKKLSPSSIFETVPIEIHNSHLLGALAVNLTLPSLEFPSSLTLNPSLSVGGALSPHFDALNVSSETYLEAHLEYLTYALEEHGTEQWKWQNWNKGLIREHQKYAAWVLKTKAENDALIAAGKPVLFTDEQIAEVPTVLARVQNLEISRFESLILTNQIETYCNQVNAFAAPHKIVDPQAQA